METRWHRYNCPKCNAQLKMRIVDDSPYSEWSSRPSAQTGYYQLFCPSCRYEAEKGNTHEQAEANHNNDIPDNPWSEW